MKAGFGTRSTDVESITDDSTTGKLNTDESDLVISVEVNSTGQVLMIKVLKIKEDSNATVEGEQQQDKFS